MSSDPPVVEAVRYQGFVGLTFRQIDEALGLPKGSAFRGFKQLRRNLVEGRDFLWLDGASHPALLDRMRTEQRIYPGTVNLTLLAPGVAAQLGLPQDSRAPASKP